MVGATNAKYFGSDPCSIKPISDALQIPVIALNRPGYAGTTALLIPTNTGSDTHYQNEARWLVETALLAIWPAYSEKSNTANSITLLARSAGCGPTLIAASLYSQLSHTLFPFKGSMLSGFGSKVVFVPPKTGITPGPPYDPMTGSPLGVSWDHAVKATFVLGEHDHEAAAGLLETANEPGYISETVDFITQWPAYWRQLAGQITVPILSVVGSGDRMLECTPETVHEFESAFTSAKGKKEFRLIEGASHCPELGIGWEGACVNHIGFALECAALYSITHKSK
ncbi:hypothetical protein K431DRAFT_290649 [Polychaeton citri CBS 116435]|uniref:Alpha/beta-hydrolase n=1 Tax=Polychaeton citri CBS 116435 TaxID=1314669 RepID=A0A9P4QIT7_9PEZI|nr:hypothetical protein K431DRAFT_290649 [Polychaeton citri CBS 116435]